MVHGQVHLPMNPVWAPGQYPLPLIPSLLLLLLCLLVSFPFLTRFIYFLAFPSLTILPE